LELERLAQVMDDGSLKGGPRVPKYVVLSDQIVDEIEAGNLKPGERLPGEADMAAKLPASLGTIQKALSRLVEQGMVVRRHGTGTFVADGHRRLIDLRHFRFLDDDGETLLPVFATVQDIYLTGDEGPWRDFLGAEGACVCVERKINVNSEFACFSRFYVPSENYVDFESVDYHVLNNVSIRAFLKDHYGVATARVNEEVAAETMHDDICKKMRLGLKTTGLVYHLRAYSYRDEPVSYQTVYIPPNCRRLEIGPNRL
jgi:GntR family transcriptional regulator